MEKDKGVIAVEGTRTLARVGVQMGLVNKVLEEDILIPYRIGKLWGYCNRDKKIVIPCIFDSVTLFNDNLAAVYQGNIVGLIDKKGNYVLQIQSKKSIKYLYENLLVAFDNSIIYKNNDKWITKSYSYIGFLRENLITVEKNEKWGFIDKNGIEVIPCIYDNYPLIFAEGLAVVKKNEKWGYIDKNGNEIISFIYDSAESFSNGVGRIKKNEKWGFVNKNGSEIIRCIYDTVDDFKNEFAYVGNNGRSDIIDKNGISLAWDGIYSLDEFNNFYAVYKNEKWGVIGGAKTLITPMIYDEIKCYSENLALVKRNKRWGFIDTNGKEIIPCTYRNAYNFKEGFASVRERRKWGFIDTKGCLAIPYSYVSVWDFTEGVVGVKKFGKWGFITSDEKMVTPFLYDSVGEFKHNVAFVYKDGKRVKPFFVEERGEGFINRTGKEIVSCKYKGLREYSTLTNPINENIFLVKNHDRWGYINLEGIEYWEDK